MSWLDHLGKHNYNQLIMLKKDKEQVVDIECFREKENKKVKCLITKSKQN